MNKNNKRAPWGGKGGIFFMILILMAGQVRADLELLSDSDMGAVNGQSSMFSTYYTDASASGNTNPGISFYRLDMNTQINFNANIAKLQLGCGGVNNSIATGCDIDISNLRFMGNDGAGGPGSAVSSDFQLGNPFIELAIKNNGTAAQQVVGFRVGALNAFGYLGFGNPDSGTGGSVAGGGINQFSGAMTAQISGVANAHVCSLSVNSNRTGCGSIFDIDYGNVPATFNQATTVSGTRLSSIQLSGNNALVLHGTILGSPLTLKADMNESMGYIHGVNVGASNTAPTPDFSTSFQSVPINWETLSTGTFPSNGAQTAQPGWWMSIPQVSMSNLVTTSYVTAFEAIGGALGYHIPITNLSMGQTPPTNCYGARFC